MNHNPGVAKVCNNSHVRQNALLDPHYLNHVVQIIVRLCDIVFNLDIVIHDLVLQREVFERLNHLLDFSSDFCGVLVLKFLNSLGNFLEVFT